MSTSHIPQPEAGAPDEVFDSVSSQVVQPVVSGLGIPAGPPQEIPAHTGQMNTFDMQLHRQWVPGDVVIWTVTQTAGTLIWKKPIHPTFMNDLIAWFSGAYNTWGGNADYRFKIAGTGFHAGAIAIVRIPPNRKPEDFPTPASWGAFEYMVLDPKTLETESVGVSDQRPIAFHYFPFNEEEPMSFGGWIAMYVLVPLNTSSTGSQQIAIQTFCKPGNNFQFSQLIMPTYKKEVDVLPAEFKDYFRDLLSSQMTTTRLYADRFQVQPLAETQTNFVTNCYDIYGNKLSKYNKEGNPFWTVTNPKDISPDLKTSFSIVRLTNQRTMFQYVCDPEYFNILRVSSATTFSASQVSAAAGGVNHTENFQKHEFKIRMNENDYPIVEATLQGDLGSLDANSYIQLSSQLWELVGGFDDNKVGPAIDGESPVLFYNEATKAYSIQTQSLTRIFRKRRIANLFLSNTCLMFLLVDAATALPLGYAKLYPEGFFAAKSVKDAIIFKKSVYLTFAGYISKTDPLPFNAEYNKNLLLYRALSR
uniref:Capsid protein n=1 Tax=Picornavirales sp. TaxID=1955153 RepID=A0A6M3YNV7_9VIRU|nr:MAG: capsid protein [Picornavirales sp.]